jgi:RND family efflux transporter MFP subunit
MRKRWTAAPIVLLALLMALNSGCSSSGGSTASARAPGGSDAAPDPEPVRVSTAKPDLRSIHEEITLSGTLAPYEQVTLYSRVDGYLESIRCDIGDFMRRGELVAEIDVPEMTALIEERRAEVARSEAALEQARAAIQQYEAELKFERLSQERLRRIRSRNQDVLPQHEVDRAEAAAGVAAGKLAKARADLLAAEAGVRAAAAAVESERMAEYARLQSPITGVITERFVDPGDLVQAASTSRTQAAPIVSVARIDRIRLLIDVPEPQAPFVGKGTRVRVSTAGHDAIEAAVARTSEVLNPASRTLRAEVDVSNPKNKLRPGMTAEVAVALRTTEDAMTVPVAAVQLRGNAYYVFVVNGDRAERRPVGTGIESSEWIQIVDGLKPSDAVVTATAAPLQDGDRVVRAAAQEKPE